MEILKTELMFSRHDLDEIIHLFLLSLLISCCLLHMRMATHV